MLFRSFSKSARPERLRPPNWDVSLVLQSLTRAPYEPLRSADERFLAQKTLFLIALASAKRIGELHALSYSVSHIRGPGVKRLLSSSWVLWQRPKTLHLRILASIVLLFRPYRKRGIILMGDYCVLYVQSSCTCAEPLHIVPRVSGSSLPQVQTPRRLPRIPSPSGSGRRSPGLKSLRAVLYLFPPLVLVRPEGSLSLFCIGRISRSPRYLVQVRGAAIPPLLSTTSGTLPTSPLTRTTWALW